MMMLINPLGDGNKAMAELERKNHDGDRAMAFVRRTTPFA